MITKIKRRNLFLLGKKDANKNILPTNLLPT